MRALTRFPGSQKRDPGHPDLIRAPGFVHSGAEEVDDVLLLLGGEAVEALDDPVGFAAGTPVVVDGFDEGRRCVRRGGRRRAGLLPKGARCGIHRGRRCPE